MSPFGDLENRINAARASADSGDKLAVALESKELTITHGTTVRPGADCGSGRDGNAGLRFRSSVRPRLDGGSAGTGTPH